MAFVVAQTIGLNAGRRSANCIHLYHGNATLLAESLDVNQNTSAQILPLSRPRPHLGHRCRCGGVLMQTILDVLEGPEGSTPARTSRSTTLRSRSW